MSDRGRYWRRLVSAWQRSGLTQVEFCRRRGVKVTAFGWWKRQLNGPGDGHRSGRGRRTTGHGRTMGSVPGRGRQTEVNGQTQVNGGTQANGPSTGRATGGRSRGRKRSFGPGRPPHRLGRSDSRRFVEVTMPGRGEVGEVCDAPRPSDVSRVTGMHSMLTMARSCVYEVVLPGGGLIRVSADFDPDAVSRLIGAVESATMRSAPAVGSTC